MVFNSIVWLFKHPCFQIFCFSVVKNICDIYFFSISNTLLIRCSSVNKCYDSKCFIKTCHIIVGTYISLLKLSIKTQKLWRKKSPPIFFSFNTPWSNYPQTQFLPVMVPCSTISERSTHLNTSHLNFIRPQRSNP